MGVIRKIILVSGIALALGSGVLMSECQQGCTTYRLEKWNKPNCEKATKELKRLNANKSNWLWDYFRGYGGKIDAYENYMANKKCPKP